MHIVATGRSMGKTTTVLSHLYAFNDAVMVVPTNQQARILQEEHPDLADRIVSATSSAGLRGRNCGRVYVDDVDHVLHHLLGAPVELATVTSEVEEDFDSPEEEKESQDWWVKVADIVAETYNTIADQTDSIEFSHEQLAADVARRVGDWYLTEVLYSEE